MAIIDLARQPDDMGLNRVREGFESGVKATGAMTVPMVLATLTGMSPMPRPIPLAIVRKVLGEDSPRPIVGIATLVSHAAYGGTWGGLLAVSSRDVSLSDGITLGAGLWGLLGAVLMPWLGWGFFGRKISGKVAPAALFLHLVYGATLGHLLDTAEADAESERATVAGLPD